MVIKNESNRKLLKALGMFLWIIAVVAAFFANNISEEAGNGVVVLAAGAGLLAFASAMFVSWVFSQSPAAEAVFVALTLLMSVDGAIIIAGNFGQEQTLPMDNSGFIVALALALAAIGGSTLGVTLINRQAAQ